MKLSVYVETTVVGALTMRPPSNLLVAARIVATQEWWLTNRPHFELFVSEAVILEISQGDPVAAKERLDAVAGIPVLPISQAAYDLAEHLIARKALPQNARVDAVHLAVAAINGIRFLLTWNCKHLANAMLRGKIESACQEFGYNPPVLCTPEQLTEVPE